MGYIVLDINLGDTHEFYVILLSIIITRHTQNQVQNNKIRSAEKFKLAILSRDGKVS